MVLFYRKPRTSRECQTPKKTRALRCERLEERLAMYAATGNSWSNPNVSFSYVPDGTASEGYTSTLFSKLDAVAPREVWQREFARALQTWANVSNLNFREVPDSGTPSGGTGAQGIFAWRPIPSITSPTLTTQTVRGPSGVTCSSPRSTPSASTRTTTFIRSCCMKRDVHWAWITRLERS